MRSKWRWGRDRSGVRRLRAANTDITAAVKPEYLVVDRHPPFTKTVANFNTLDYLRLLTITGVSVTVGYLSGIKPNVRGPSMVTGGLIGVLGGFMYAYQNSASRLMGFFPNDDEVARYK
ncbi:NADH-ubiquinone oxidoreductase complex I, 21 kDa subunit [Musa troglodytarum]|uniref:NADH-ubiquinone oxidoreductase complex I, 21 kDa subunit n=1 Tax=Musa troglodytarum TaxID=320322 RepID=A0A9E7FBX0_9LILI|nr:NADH-ubiquinone oxidoreductase complex I, 21 kDa subunit [Musa troglodytarum]